MWATARRGWGVLALALVAMAAAGVGADTAVEIGPAPSRAPLQFAYSHDGGDLTTAVHRCVGVGKCRADTSAGKSYSR